MYDVASLKSRLGKTMIGRSGGIPAKYRYDKLERNRTATAVLIVAMLDYAAHSSAARQRKSTIPFAWR